jgi:hypothetical protein
VSQKGQPFDKMMGDIKRWETISLRVIRYCKLSKDLGGVVYDSKVSSKSWGYRGRNQEPKERDDSGEQEVGMDPIDQKENFERMLFEK